MTDHYWKIRSYNSMSVIAWGTEGEARKYCDLINHINGRVVNMTTYDLIDEDDYPEDRLPLADRCELNLADELAEWREMIE